jgi:adenylate cyclase
MDDTPVRKLAVLLHADVVSSTELVRKSETLAHQRIHDAFQRLSKTVFRFNGLAHEIRGDALVAEFQMASDAAAAAVDYQATNTAHNQKLTDEILPVIRIGIALGEVVIADNTITGEGIVLAQRLEQLAEPGGICLQGAIYETIPKRFPFAYEDLGEQNLKGFEEPIRAYSIRQPSHSETAVSVAHTLYENVALEIPDKPSIAVLPFANMSGDPEQEYFSDGITEDIITALSRISGLLVIAPNSAMVYKDKAVDVKKVALEQGVQHVLEGSVRKSGNRIRVTAQLIDATTGHHQWAERYDREVDDVFAVQDDITHQITVAMQVEISVGEKAQMLACRTSNIHAWERLIRADDLNRSFVRANNIKARALLEEAVVLDPDFVSAWVELGWVHWADVHFGWSASSEQSAKLANEAAARALALEPEYPNAYSLLGFMALTTKDFERGIELCRKGASLAPNNAENIAELASALILAGQAEEAEQFIRRAIRLSPICPPYYLIIVGLCHLVKSDLESAVSTLRIAVEQLPDSIWPKVYLISALVESGHLDEARKLAREVQSLQRDFSIDAWRAIRFKDPEFRARTHDNLLKAGLSE